MIPALIFSALYLKGSFFFVPQIMHLWERIQTHFYIKVVKSGLVTDVYFYLVPGHHFSIELRCLMLLSVVSDKIVTGGYLTLIKMK